MFKRRSRRREQRVVYVAPVEARCSNWTSFHKLFSGNVSEAGIFVATDREAEVGTTIDLNLQAPDGAPLALKGTVRHVFRQASKRGLGIRIEEVAPADRKRYEWLVHQAKARCEPRPAGSSGPPPLPDSVVSHLPPPPPGRGDDAHAPPLVAIDFGTSRSSVAIMRSNEAQVLRLPNGDWDMPSIVAFNEAAEALVGIPGREMLATDPANAISSPKRLMGRRHDDDELQAYLSNLAMPHSAGPGGQILLHPRSKRFTIPQICAPILFSLRQVAERELGGKLDQVVLTAPVSFTDQRYQALRDTAGLAGLKIAEVIDEPSAAALTHRLDRDFRGLVAVYDFGGGTFDFSVVDVNSADCQVVATAGDTWLGGDDFDEALASAAANAFWKTNKLEIRNQVVQWHRLLVAAERAKRVLSTREQATIEVEKIALTPSGPVDLRHTVSREEFAELVQPIIQRSLDTCAQAMELGGVRLEQIQAVYLSGGTSYIPAVRAAVARAFGKPPKAAVPPERAVVLGAAIYAALQRTSRIAL